MLSKNEIKDIQSLSHKKFRDERGVFVAEGPKVVEALLQSIPGQLVKLYATAALYAEGKLSTELMVQVTEAELERISQLQTPNQVLALFKKMEWPELSKNKVSLYLDTIQDPGNFGTIVRTADWFGVGQIVCSPGCADPYNAKVVQATMASIAHVKIYEQVGYDWLENQEGPVYAAVLDGQPFIMAPKMKSGVLIIGNESKGIHPDCLRYATQKLTIPAKGSAESLNASVAAGILLSHLLS